MQNKIFKKIISLLLIVFMVLSIAIFESSSPVEAATNYETYYKLYTGCYSIWSNSAGVWQYTGYPGASKTINTMANVDPKAVNIKVYSYDGTNFDFNNKPKHTWFPTEMAKNQDEYGKEYLDRAAIISKNSGSTIGSPDSKTGQVKIKFDVTLRDYNPKKGPLDLKYMLSEMPGGKEAIIKYVGVADDNLKKIMNLLDPTSTNYSPTVKGFMYFLPYVVEYQIKKDDNNLSMTSVQFIDSSGKVTTEPKVGQKYTTRYNIKYTGEDMPSNVLIGLEKAAIKNRSGGGTYYVGNGYLIDSLTQRNVKLKNGQTTYIDVGPYVISTASIYSYGTIKYDANWNQNTTDDYGSNEINGLPNNLEMVSVEFLDSSGNITTNPILGKNYTARYNIKYTGSDMVSNSYIAVENGHIRNKKSGNRDYWTSFWSKGKYVKLKNGDTTYFEVGPFPIHEANIYTCANIRYDKNWNLDTSDDFGEKEINGIIENLSIVVDSISPAITKVYSPQSETTVNYEIAYTVNYTTSENAALVTELRLVLENSTLTNPNSFVLTKNISLSPGVNHFTIKTNDLRVRNRDGKFSFSLEVNKSRTHPSNESSYADNKDTVWETVQSIPSAVLNPCVGEINRENPSWTVTYNISTKTGAWVETGYHGTHRGRCNEWQEDPITGKQKCVDREPRYPCTCTRCRGGSVDNWTVDSVRKERFEITAINFTSKDSGTVNLINRDGKIKAGYGFDLEVIAKYTGTESKSRPATWGGCNYQRVTPEAYVLNSLPNSIYVVMPDGQIISNNSSTGIKKLMDCSVSSSGNLSRTLRCQIVLGNTFGNKETRKIYIDEKTADGTYNMTVCTAKFNGVSPYATKPLYDMKRVKFIVDGRWTDDVTTHIVQ